jgi:hypothetical protein
LLDSIWKQIEAHLEAERQRIYDEIKTYPRPIPACDLQFNHLLEKRAGISQELDRMHELAKESLGRCSLGGDCGRFYPLIELAGQRNEAAPYVRAGGAGVSVGSEVGRTVKPSPSTKDN